MSAHLYTYDNPPSERDLARAERVLQADGVLAYPNDLNWAFGCDAASAKALDRVHLLKPAHAKEQPFSLLCSSIAMAAEYATIDNTAYRLLRKAWPGPFTVLLNATKTLPRQLKDKRRVVGIRIPASALLQALVGRLGRPLATTSVPLLDDKPAAFGYQVFEAFGHGLDLLLDLGSELPGLESTIIDLTEEGVAKLIRQGAGDAKIFECLA